MNRPAQPANNRREEILQAAKRLFAERGFRETNLNELAEILGFKRQAIYYYFPSKDELLFELMGRAGRAVDEAQAALDRTLPAVEQLREVARIHVRELLHDADVFRIQFEEASRLEGERGEAIRQAQASYVHRVADIIRRAQADGDLVEMPPVAMALSILGMCNGVVTWFDPNGELSIDDVAEDIARLAVDGARRRDEKPTTARRTAVSKKPASTLRT